MQNNDFRHLDLNLLRIFVALLEEGNATAAGERLGLAQSSVSHALGRLRDTLHDPLFVRSSGGMRPTSLALRIAEPISNALKLLQETLEQERTFDPSDSRRIFNLAMTDAGEMLIMPKLMAALTALAPHVKIVVHQRSRSEYRDALEQDIVELAIGQLPASHTDFLQQHLTDEHFVCILRSGHSRIDNFTLDAYLQAGHVVIGAPAFSETHIRKALGAMANRRQVALEVGHYLVVPPIIAETDLVAIVSDTVANYFRGHSAIASVPVPFELPPIIFRQFWHERTNLDPGCQWLRKVISKVLA